MHPGFKTLSGFISSLEVVNDAGERGVKLIQVTLDLRYLEGVWILEGVIFLTGTL